MATTIEQYEGLVRDTRVKTGKLTRIAEAFEAHVSVLQDILFSVRLKKHIKQLIRDLDSMEQTCNKCDKVCDFPIKEPLERVVSLLQSGISMREKRGYPHLALMRPLRSATERLEDKLESYWLASDQELRDLCSQFAEGVRRQDEMQ